MIELFLMALGVLQEPASIPELVRALDDDSIEVRTDAADKLVALGERAAEALRKLPPSAKSPELAVRIEKILLRIELEKCRRDYKGGTRIGGLGATLRQRKSEPGGPLLFELEIVNLDLVDRPLIGVASWDFCLPDGTEGTTSAEAALGVERLDPPPPQSKSLFVDCVKEPPRSPEALGPGKSRVFVVPLKRESLGKGEFEIKALYFSKKLLGSKEDLLSNSLRLSLRN